MLHKSQDEELAQFAFLMLYSLRLPIHCFLQVVVLSVGSNDNASSPEDVSAGIVTCTTAIKSRLPEAQVVVLVSDNLLWYVSL